MDATARTLRVADPEGGRRLDVFLAEQLQLSRAQVRRLLARGAVRLEGRPAGEGAKGVALAAGQTVEVAPFTRPERQRVSAEPDAPLAVLAEGSGWLAVDKPAGVPVHPLREGETGTLLGAVLARYPEAHGVGEGGLRSGVVHRLDVDTSGALLFATREPVWQQLRRAFRERRVEKVYRALVWGRVEEPGEIRLGLVLARHRPARVRVVSEAELARARGATLCETRWQPVERFAEATLLEVHPVTGFLHQIRATLASLGFPVLGDRVYASGLASRAAPRHLLHAARIACGEVAAASPDPPDFAAACQRLRGW